MAPVTATTTGISHHPIDDPGIVTLLERLRSYDNINDLQPQQSSNDGFPPAGTACTVDIEGLVGELERLQEWRYTEQTDLYEWIEPLDAMDSVLRKFMNDFPTLFLIGPSNKDHSDGVQAPQQSDESSTSDGPCSSEQAQSEDEADSVPPSIKHAITTVLRFMATLLRNSYNKSVFNSVQEVTDLLAAADDDIASLALEVLAALAIPSQIHKLSVPDTSQNGTVLHNSPSSNTHTRLMMLAKGWGSRGSGLGLATTVTTDDSPSGQGALPQYAGEVRFEFLPPSSTKVINIHLSLQDVCLKHNMANRTSNAGLDRQVEKKRKMTSASTVGGPASSETKTTSHLFFHCLDEIGGRKNISRERLFDLLVHIRLAKSFHSRSARIKAVEGRLQALLTVLYAHPSHDVLAGYFHAQPELCVELTDLVRPTVSQAAVSSTGSVRERTETIVGNDFEHQVKKKQAVIESIINSSADIPYVIRTLAIEVLTALVRRKEDATNGVMTQIARQANVLGELGVAKGQFLGLLPTLIRYSLAALKSFVPTDNDATKKEEEENKMCPGSEMDEDDFGMELGIAFVNATKQKMELGHEEYERKALEFISCVLSLAYSVINVSSGTAALTDCGLIPVLVSTIALGEKLNTASQNKLSGNGANHSYTAASLKFVIAQSIQILEGAITNNNQALSAFHDLKGIEILVSSLSVELKWITVKDQSKSKNPSSDMSVDMHDGTNTKPHLYLQGSSRVLMYSTLNCLTVVFHLQETSSRSASVSVTPGSVLRRKEMTEGLIDIMDNASTYCGVLTSLAVTFLGDTMNSDPRMVHYVYESGLAESLFRMLKAESTVSNTNELDPIDGTSWHEPMIPASPELVVALPNVITALALTEDGRKRLSDVNPIPEILGILCSPRFAMPLSRCMSGDMASMIGSGLDELMRHVPSLKLMVIWSIVSFVKRVVFLGGELVKEELALDQSRSSTSRSCVEDSRIRFMQYTHNISNILEQILQNDEHCGPFVDAGGVEALLELHPFLMPSGRQFLAHISTQSSPSVAILTHSTTALSLTSAIKRVASNGSITNILKKVKRGLLDGLESVEGNIKDLRNNTDAVGVEDLCLGKCSDYRKVDTSGILEGIPRVPLNMLHETKPNPLMVKSLSCFLRDIINIEWMTQLLSAIIKMASSSDIGHRGRNQWQEEISSKEFLTLIAKLGTLYQCSFYEVCRIRTEENFDDRDSKRWNAPGESDYHPAKYRLRIVCAEGAVVRDGIDIDSCASVGGLEMGEEVDAFDRCVNGSGIMRYRTSKGWVSEQTRGHGREPISEVLDVCGVATERRVKLEKDPKTKKALECGISDLCAASASVLARLQNSQSYLYSCLSRVVVTGFKLITTRSSSSQENLVDSHVGVLTREISDFLRSNFHLIESSSSKDQKMMLNKGGEAMYLGGMLNILHCCIYEERRERQTLNVLIFCNLLVHDGHGNAIFIPEAHTNGSEASELYKLKLPATGFYGAIFKVLQYGLLGMAKTFIVKEDLKTKQIITQRQSKSVASSFPCALSLLRRLTSQSLLIDSSVNSYLNKMRGEDFINFAIGDPPERKDLLERAFFSFRQDSFARYIHCTIAVIAQELWSDSNLKFAPPHVLNPILSLVSEVFVSLENSSKNNVQETDGEPAARSLVNQMSLWASRRPRIPALDREMQRNQSGEEEEDVPPPPFEPSEETVRRMADMGFTREHALNAIQSSRSNIVEVAMEYALSNPATEPTSSQPTASTRTDENNSVTADGNNNQMSHTTKESGGDTIQEGSKKASTHEDEKPAEKKLTEAEKRKIAEKDFDAKTLTLVRKSMDDLKGSIVECAINVMEGPKFSEISDSMGEKIHDGLETDSEVLNTVICTFLLELCDRYPAERSKMLNQLLSRLKSHLELDIKGNHVVIDQREKNFSSICHATVIFLRALPRLRTLVLKQNIATCILQCIRGFSSKLRHSRDVDQNIWPCWLSSALLLMDIMSQPISLGEDERTTDESHGSLPHKGDYNRILSEHKRQQVALNKTSKKISAAFGKAKAMNKRTKARDVKKNEEKANEESTEVANEAESSFADLPAFFPLLTQDMAESLLAICLQLFRYQQKKHETRDKEVFYIPPIIAHALLLVLTKTLRSQKLASHCLRMGGAELLLSLQRKSRFNGHISLITLALRRMVEDENTLQTIMESEIRSTVTKLVKKKSRGPDSNSHTISSRSFIENISPLICRDPIIFLKAAATSIKLSRDPSTNSNGKLLELLPADERAKNTKVLVDCFRSSSQSTVSHSTNSNKSSLTSAGNRKGRPNKVKQNISKALRSKSPHKGSKKATKKEKQEKMILGSSANHVTSQLLTALLKHYRLNEISEDLPFLCTVEYLEIIGDLVLSVPACTAAIHSYQMANTNVVVSHALNGCQQPPQNIVNFLLHELLSLSRETPTKEIKDNNEPSSLVSREPFMKTRTSQYAARLLVALVARAGEGRRRVISELSHSLRGNDDDDNNDDVRMTDESDNCDREMWALNSWGELCIGLAAPRRINPTHDTESSLSFEVVKVMQEFGMAHALMSGIKRINLMHPLAATTAASLLRPLENFTRPAVISALQLLAKKAEKKPKPSSKVDDAMLGDGFDIDVESRNLPWLYNNDDTVDSLHEAGNGEDDVDDDMQNSFDEMEEDSIIMSTDESEEENSDSSDSSDSDESEDGDNDDDDSSSDPDSDEEIVEDGEDVIEIDDDDDDDDGDDNEMDIEEPRNPELQVDNGDTDDDFFEGNDENEDEVEGSIQIDGDFDGEGWMNVEAGLGNIFGSRNEAGAMGRPRTAGGGAFMIEAAETVIGNILRSGGLHVDALAEIEDTLGIRIASRSGGTDQSRFPPHAVNDTPLSDRNRFGSTNDRTLSSQNRGPLAAIPIINQRSPPDNYFSLVGSTGRIGEINHMEYQYGGPPLGSNRMYYALSCSNSSVERPHSVDQLLQIPTSFDTQLFPNGSAASTHSRPPSVSHPLISGVILPPSNALISIATRHIEDSGQAHRTVDNGDSGWGDLRMNRGTGISVFNRTQGNNSRGINGWSDDGQPMDNAATDFSRAFEDALTSTILNPTAVQSTLEDNSSITGTSNQTTNGRDASNGNLDTSNEALVTERTEENEAQMESDSNQRTEENEAPVETNSATTVAREENNTSDDENVATSLAASLTLSNTGTPNNEANSGEQSNNSSETNNAQETTASNVETSVNEGTRSTEELANNEGTNNDEGESDDSNSPPIAESIQEPDSSATNDPPESNTLTCPPGMDEEVFGQLPIEMQQEIIEQHQATENVAAQLDARSGLDPEALAALPEDMRREVIEQEQNQRRIRENEEAPADPSNAEEMDNASFIASLAPNLRQEILLTSDETVLNSLPPDMIAEAHLLRERAASSRHRRDVLPTERQDNPSRRWRSHPTSENANAAQSRSSHKKKTKTGKICVHKDKASITYKPNNGEKDLGPLVTPSSLKPLLSLMYLLSPVRPQRLLQKLFQNFCANSDIRNVIINTFSALLNDEPNSALSYINSLCGKSFDASSELKSSGSFPPTYLLGASPDIENTDPGNMNINFFKRRHGSSTAAAIAFNLPLGSRCSMSGETIPPVVARRIVGTMTFLTKSGNTTALDILRNFDNGMTHSTSLDNLLGLLGRQSYSQSSSNLEDLLNLVDSVCAPLSLIPGDNDIHADVSKKDLDAASDAGKQWVEVPRTIVSPEKLHLLCSTLRLESCKDGVFTKVNNIVRRLCKVTENRECILRELASVAQTLGIDAVRDLRALRIRLNNAMELHQDFLESKNVTNSSVTSIPSTTVTLSTSSSELKLLRVLQTLHSLCAVLPIENTTKRNDGGLLVREELVPLLQSINLVPVWDQLTACLHAVSVLEGVSNESEEKELGSNEKSNKQVHGATETGKKLQNSVAGLLSRFLPTIEAFFVVNASATDAVDSSSGVEEHNDLQRLVGGQQLIDFVVANKVLINAILRSSPSLLDKGLRAMVRIPRCRPFLDFDVKRQWFRSQVRRLRQHANRRHGSLRLNIRRQVVFEDAFNALMMRDADEMRGRLHITFDREEGVDAGGLSREFFAILAKEMFNPNYALFTSTEDGCTFQPNPHSSINQNHLTYFKFVGRIVGKAVADGFLLDAHFTRSLYKHMLGMKPTYHDMQAIDPDYYKNLKMILEYNLEDIGLELTFSTEVHSFGKISTIDLIPNGRNIKVTEDTKEKYVSLVCQHRMTDAIKEQIKAYLDGFYELVKPDLISIFTAKELELLISGMPDIDIHDLKKNTDYQGYRASDKQMGWFWNIMFSLSKSEKAAFLQFTTGSSKVPLNGFAELQGMRGIQKFSIHKVGGGAEGALMSAHTCFNSLDLPVYPTEEIMREKLLMAIKEGAGGFLFS